jgi:hypothetical protein
MTKAYAMPNHAHSQMSRKDAPKRKYRVEIDKYLTLQALYESWMECPTVDYDYLRELKRKVDKQRQLLILKNAL